MKNFILLLSAGILLFSSACTVNKRAHRPGYNVEWHSANPKPQKHPKQEEGKAAPSPENEAFVDENAIAEENARASENQATASDEYVIAGTEKGSGILSYERKLGKRSEANIEAQEPRSESNGQEAQPQQRNSQADNLAIWGFVISLAGFWIPFAGPIAAIVFSAIALNQMRENPIAHRHRGLAIAGLIIGILGLAFWSFFLIGNIYWWW